MIIRHLFRLWHVACSTPNPCLNQYLLILPVTGDFPSYRPGPCITNVIATCRKNFSQWESSFLWKLRFHWLKFLRRVAKTLVIQGPVTRSFDVFFDLGLNKRLSKKSRRHWFEVLIMTSLLCGRIFTNEKFLYLFHFFWFRKAATSNMKNRFLSRTITCEFWYHYFVLFCFVCFVFLLLFSIEIYIFSFKKIHLKMSSGKCRSFCLGLNVLKYLGYAKLRPTVISKTISKKWTDINEVSG